MVMKNAILVHGTCSEKEYFSDEYPSLSNSHWFPWLQKQLLVNGIFTQTPEILDAYKPNYKKWKNIFEQFEINANSILIGHSCGGGFLLRWLSENKIQVDKLILVAPWLDPEREKTTEFFDFEIDRNLFDKVNELHLFFSNDDDNDILQSVKIIRGSFENLEVHEYSNLGHFCYNDMKTDKFPDLLNIIIK